MVGFRTKSYVWRRRSLLSFHQWPVSEEENQSGYTESHQAGRAELTFAQCDGNVPCRPCMTKGRECQRHGIDMRGRWRSKEQSLTAEADMGPQLQGNQSQSNLVTTTGRNGSVGSEETERECSRLSDQEARRDTSISSRRVPAFSGETSMAHSLTVVEGRLEQMGVRYQGHCSAPPNRSFSSRLTPSPDSSISRTTQRQPNFVSQVLNHHGILPNREQWDGLMSTFCDEVHILVPFLHPPSLWTLYEEMCASCLHGQSNAHDKTRGCQLQAAHVLLCLANGRSVGSSQCEGGQGSFSAGWSLYSAARELFGDLIDGFSRYDDQLFLLQTILLMVRLSGVLKSFFQLSLTSFTGNLSLST